MRKKKEFSFKESNTNYFFMIEFCQPPNPTQPKQTVCLNLSRGSHQLVTFPHICTPDCIWLRKNELYIGTGNLHILCSSLFFIMPVQNLPFVENMEKRIQSASLLLDASLGHCFVDALEHRDATAIYNCLRAYAAVDNTRNAEDIFRMTVVLPLIQKVIPQSGVVSGASGDELADDYQQIEQHIVKDCKFLLEIASAGRPT